MHRYSRLAEKKMLPCSYSARGAQPKLSKGRKEEGLGIPFTLLHCKVPRIWQSGTEHKTPKNCRWALGGVFSCFMLSKLAFSLKKHSQSMLWNESFDHHRAESPDMG
jgi:hypothetical protein